MYLSRWLRFYEGSWWRPRQGEDIKAARWQHHRSWRWAFPMLWSSVPIKFCWHGGSGIQDTTFQSIMKCDVDVRKGLCSNVLLSGGITMVASIDKHLPNELIALAATTDDLICVIEKRRHVWHWTWVVAWLVCLLLRSWWYKIAGDGFS